MEPQWYFYFDRIQDGPLAQATLTRRFGERLVPLYALVWSSAWPDEQWRPAREVPPFLRAALAPPLPVPKAIPAVHPAPPRRPAHAPVARRPLAGTAGVSLRRPGITLNQSPGRPRVTFAPRPAVWSTPPAAQPPLTAFVVVAVVLLWLFFGFVFRSPTSPVIHQPPGWVSSSTPSEFFTPSIDDRPPRRTPQYLYTPTASASQIRALLPAARAEILAGRWRQAITAYERILALDAASFEALCELGLAYDFDGRAEHARADWGIAVFLAPANDREHAYRALAYIGMDQIGKALPDLRRAALIPANDAWNFCLRGQARYWLQEYALAVPEFDTAILLDPKAAFAFHLRASAHRQLRQYDLAVQDEDEALRLNPQYGQALYQRGRVYLDLEQYDRALGDFTEAIRLNPHNAAAHVGRGDVYRSQHRNDRAVTEYSVALQTDPTLRAAYVGRAAAYRALGMPAEADKDEERAGESGTR